MAKLNCWEFTKCGREPGGVNAAAQGVCPAASENALDGVHGGVNSGRACWVLAGTFCGGEVVGSAAKKIASCKECAFYKLVMAEEGESALPTTSLIRRLNCAGRLD
ncbi:MAG TPA: hypothetical protein VI078_06015 [bacterium]